MIKANECCYQRLRSTEQNGCGVGLFRKDHHQAVGAHHVNCWLPAGYRFQRKRMQPEGQSQVLAPC